MAVNHVDGMTFGGAIVCPIASGAIVMKSGAGWLTLPCLIAALPVCFSVLYIARKLTYLIMGIGLRSLQSMKPWAQHIFGAPFLLVYVIVPIIGAVAAVYCTSSAAVLLAGLAADLGGWLGIAG